MGQSRRRRHDGQKLRETDVLSAEKNRSLARVASGHADGRLHAAVLDADRGRERTDANPVKAVRLFGEDLVLYRISGANTGCSIATARIAARTCRHGFVEGTGIRCNCMAG